MQYLKVKAESLNRNAIEIEYRLKFCAGFFFVSILRTKLPFQWNMKMCKFQLIFFKFTKLIVFEWKWTSFNFGFQSFVSLPSVFIVVFDVLETTFMTFCYFILCIHDKSNGKLDSCDFFTYLLIIFSYLLFFFFRKAILHIYRVYLLR